MLAAGGTYGIAGQAAAERRGRTISAATGAYNVTGIAATLVQGSPWSSSATWGGPPPGDGENVTIPSGASYILDTDTANLGLIVIPAGATLKVDMTKPSLTLRAKGIVVDGGKFIFGTRAAPYTGTLIIELDGQPVVNSIVGPSHRAADVPTGNPNDAYLGYDGASRGFLNINGEVRINVAKASVLRTFLNANSAAGATSHTTEDSTNWPAGSNVLIGPTDYYANSQSEVHTLAAAANGTAIQTSAGLVTARWGQLQYITDAGMSLTPGTYTRWTSASGAEFPANTSMPTTLDERAEVALLDRRAIIRAPNDTAFQQDRFGVHVMAMGSGAITELDGVLIHRCGQGGRLGRYPFHTHMQSWASTGQFLGAVHTDNRVEDCVVWQSWNRGITLHGSVGFKVLNCVSHDTRGHNLFFEDGSERLNTVVGNWLSAAENPNTDAAVSVTCTPGTPATFTRTAHGFQNGRALRLGGSYPTGFPSAGSSSSPTVFWVVNATANTFQLSDIPGGAALASTSAGSGLTVFRWWALKLHDAIISGMESGASGAWVTNMENELRDNRCFGNRGRGMWEALQYSKKWCVGLGGAALFQIGSPGKVLWTNHGFSDGQTLIYSCRSTATPPAGLTSGQAYWVRNPTANDFELSTTPAGPSLALMTVGSTGSLSHTLMTGGCFGASANVPLIPFFTPPLLDGSGLPMVSRNVCHSNGGQQLTLEFAAINERGATGIGSSPSSQANSIPTTRQDGNGPHFKSPPHRDGTSTNGVFDQFILWKGSVGGYHNRVVNPKYRNWLTADLPGVHLFGATQEGFNNDLNPGTLVCESLNVTTPPATVSNVDNGVASYHSGLFFRNIVAVGFAHTTPTPANAAHVSSPHYQLMSRSFMQTWDLYTDPVEMQTGFHENWRMVNSDRLYRTPPPHIQAGYYDQWAGAQYTPYDVDLNNDGDTTDAGDLRRRWTLAGALWDLTGAMCGTPRRYITYNHPYTTYGLTGFSAESPATKMTVITPDHIYGIGHIADDSGTFEFTTVPGQKVFTRLRPSDRVVVSGAVWDIPDGTDSSFLNSMQHGTCPRAGMTRFRMPARGAQSTVMRFRLYNVSRKAGVNDTQDDFFYLDVNWSRAVIAQVWAAVGVSGSWPNFSYDPAWVGIGRAAQYTRVNTFDELTASSGLTFWQDSTFDFMIIKIASHHHSWSGWGSGSHDTDARAFDLVVQPA
jgi:hypothetical protein